jgi:hypothetical protein
MSGTNFRPCLRGQVNSNVKLNHMPLHKVYADFNAIEYRADEPAIATVALTGYGTLASLATQKLRLSEGMSVLIFEPNDVECEATVHFDLSRLDPAGRMGEWVARVVHRNIRSSTEPGSAGAELPCLVCGATFPSQPRNYRETCATCGASVMEPLAPPKNAA